MIEILHQIALTVVRKDIGQALAVYGQAHDVVAGDKKGIQADVVDGQAIGDVGAFGKAADEVIIAKGFHGGDGVEMCIRDRS